MLFTPFLPAFYHMKKKGATQKGDNHMKTLEDYKQALLDQPSTFIREKLLAQADADGFTAWELAELAGVGCECWA